MKNLMFILIIIILIPGMRTAHTQQHPTSPHGKGFTRECSQCHTTARGWQLKDALDFDHGETGFPLNGQHQSVACRNCHTDLIFANIGVMCADCHPDEVHHGELGSDCERCHHPVDWQYSASRTYDHQQTGFPLVGRHALLDCGACHVAQEGDLFSGRSTTCASCHAGDFFAARSPDHVNLHFSTDCESCHSAQHTVWEQARFTHPATFPLVGGHRQTDCGTCHNPQHPLPQAEDCYACHETDFQHAKNPDHLMAGFPTDCTICHNTFDFEEATAFDHTLRTDFPLEGRHRQTGCLECHGDGVFNGKSTECVICHAGAYQQTQNPDHLAAQFPTTCDICHTPTGWEQTTFDHNTYTSYPLVGFHAQADCNQCHTDGVYTGTPTDCAICHETDYQQTEDPNHTDAGFPTECALCHDPYGWEGAVFDHNTRTDFPLVGRHTGVACIQCHADGVYDGKPDDCYSCHAAEYETTRDPDHQAAGFSTRCEFCHSPFGWEEGHFDHNSTDFPLIGRHRNADCGDCHADNIYDGKSTDCYSCHMEDYLNADDPDHVALNYPTDCSLCHTPHGWDDDR